MSTILMNTVESILERNEDISDDRTAFTSKVGSWWPAKWTVWRHRNGNEYVVYDITNGTSDRDEYPVMISYYNLHAQTKYSRQLFRWTNTLTHAASTNPSFTFLGYVKKSLIPKLQKEINDA